jgi:hypothetical protein
LRDKKTAEDFRGSGNEHLLQYGTVKLLRNRNKTIWKPKEQIPGRRNDGDALVRPIVRVGIAAVRPTTG